MQKYEIAVLYHPDLEVDLSKAEERVTNIFKGNKGAVVEADNWGKRKLAYSIKELDHAVYVFYTVELPAEQVAKVEYTLNITDEVIRFLIVKIDPKQQQKIAEMKKEKEERAAKRHSSGEDSDDRNKSSEKEG